MMAVSEMIGPKRHGAMMSPPYAAVKPDFGTLPQSVDRAGGGADRRAPPAGDQNRAFSRTP